jgi:hypothetical protein
MTRTEYEELKAKVRYLKATEPERVKFWDLFADIEDLLNEGDLEDAFGTEGWRHNLGIE